jgi:hypothetical protein
MRGFIIRRTAASRLFVPGRFRGKELQCDEAIELRVRRQYTPVASPITRASSCYRARDSSSEEAESISDVRRVKAADTRTTSFSASL